MRWKILIFNAITYLTIKFYDFGKSYLARRVTFADDAGFLCFIVWKQLKLLRTKQSQT